MNTIANLTEFSNRYSQRDTNRMFKLDEAGIGYDVTERFSDAQEAIALHVAEFTRQCYGQLSHELLVNVLCGISMRSIDAKKLAEKCVHSAIVHCAASLCGWGITETMELGADIMEDANAHPEALLLRKIASGQIKVSDCLKCEKAGARWKPIMEGYVVETCVELPIIDGEANFDAAVYKRIDFGLLQLEEAKKKAKELLRNDKFGAVQILQFRLEPLVDNAPIFPGYWHKVYEGIVIEISD